MVQAGTGIAKRRIPILLCSLGNPGAAFAGTRHNAGHVMLDLYRSVMRLPEYETQKVSGGAISTDDRTITLFRSGSYMNDSGSAVARAYREFLKQSPNGRLCVLHDEMETVAGHVKLRMTGKGKGHNGIRSCIKHLGTEEFARMAIGIGRPDSRDSSVVTKWVLGRLTSEEQRRLQEDSLLAVIEHLDRLQLV